MRFRYEPYVIKGSGSRHLEMVDRPMVLIRVVGGTGVETLPGLLDTGADDTVLPEFLLDKIGIAPIPGDEAVIEGFDGTPTVIRYASVDFELEDPAPPRTVLRWQARVGFHHRYSPALGHNGFLEHFIAMFNGRTREVVLKAHDPGMTP